MANLTQAPNELFRRTPDECFPSLTALFEHCKRQKQTCVDRWGRGQLLRKPGEMRVTSREREGVFFPQVAVAGAEGP